MTTLFIIALLCAAFGLRFEGTIRANAAGRWMAKLGRLNVGLWAFRPGHVYVLVEAR